MPWTPLKYAKEIFTGLKEKGYTSKVTTQILSTEIMKHTGIIKLKTRANVIKAFEELGYIKAKGSIWEIKYWEVK